jgi:hypothetical protein
MATEPPQLEKKPVKFSNLLRMSLPCSCALVRANHGQQSVLVSTCSK